MKRILAEMRILFIIFLLGLLPGTIGSSTEDLDKGDEIELDAKKPTRSVKVYQHMLPEKNTWSISKGGKVVKNCKGGPYVQWYAFAKTRCKLAAGKYTVTCCDKKTMDGWGE